TRRSSDLRRGSPHPRCRPSGGPACAWPRPGPATEPTAPRSPRSPPPASGQGCLVRSLRPVPPLEAHVVVVLLGVPLQVPADEVGLYDGLAGLAPRHVHDCPSGTMRPGSHAVMSLGLWRQKPSPTGRSDRQSP